ncbi:MAG TPA: hypothetical protein PLO94_03660 [Chitinophagales bacterium]|nr:hypothetical protein [Chitinophagales bacterium]
MKQILFLLVAFFIFDASAQKTLNGVTLPAKVKANNQELVLNGGGIKKSDVQSLCFRTLYTCKN